MCKRSYNAIKWNAKKQIFETADKKVSPAITILF